jgi:hypothetical protein
MRRVVEVTAPPTSGGDASGENEVILNMPRRILKNARSASGVTFEPFRSGPLALAVSSTAISSASSSTSTGSCVDTAGATRVEREVRELVLDNLLGNLLKTGARATVRTAAWGTDQARACECGTSTRARVKLDMAGLRLGVVSCASDD